MTRRKSWLMRVAAVLLCLVGAAWIFSGPILRGLGFLLVNDGPPVNADMIVVLAGDVAGDRVLKGAELAREGFAPVVIVSNGGRLYGHSESELAVEFAVQHGYSPDLFITARWVTTSTVDEAHSIIRALRRRGAHRIVVVSTLWHTARAGRIFRRLAPDLEFHMVGAEDPTWHNGAWWTDREGRKNFFLETVKTFADFWRI